MIGTVLMYILSVLLILSYLYAILSTNPLYSTLSMGVSFFLTAFVFILLDAPFLAAVQIIVYVGAMLILFLFVIMMFNLRKSDHAFIKFKPASIASYLIIMLIAVIGFYMARAVFKMPEGFVISGFGSAQNIGFSLLKYYLLPFELASFVLLVGIFGALTFIKKKRDQ
ncbi:MAG: NADH-quinone oxidoreductase subunit J [Deltaproteobacteria bacterium]|nr:NADH-quinone oxidoreductase subunit J [Deltaproteobacteria bacterium]MCL5792140.1 NADH-quinone oxidoreductase subunit J [Deltaproteobacteria bacterium]